MLQVGPFVDIGAEYPWVSMKPSGSFVCDLCSAFHVSVVGYSSKTFGRGPSNPFLSQNGGASLGEAVSANEFRRCFQKHESSVGHKLCLEAEAEAKKRNLLRNSLSDLDQRDEAVMMRLLMVMGHIAKRKRPCLEYEYLMLLLEMTGEDVGGKCHGRKACAEMVGSSSDVMLLQLREFVTSTNELMSHKPHVSAGADKMTDASHDQWQPVNVRLNVRGTPTTVNVDLSPVDADYDAETAAGGFSMFNKLLESLELIGLHLIVNGVSIFDPANGQTSEQLRSVAFDNELCYQGKESGVRHYFHDATDGYGDPTVLVIKDLPHSFDLLVEDGQGGAMEEYLTLLHKTINEIYSFFVRSPKQFRGLQKLIELEGSKFAALKQFKDLRFVAFEAAALEAMIEDLPAVAKRLKDLVVLTQPGEEKTK